MKLLPFHALVSFLACFSPATALQPLIYGGNDPYKPRIVVCAMVRNEMAYLPEWIEYNYQIGVDHIRIYDDNSSDGVNTLPALIMHGSPWGRRGTLEVVPVRPASEAPQAFLQDSQQLDAELAPRQNRQSASFTDCVNSFHKAQWIGIYDVDEFIMPDVSVREGSGQRTHMLRKLLQAQPSDISYLQFQDVRYGTCGFVSKFDQGVQIGSKSRSACYKVGTRQKQINLVLETHTCRGPNANFQQDGYESAIQSQPECLNAPDWKWTPCKGHPGKQFVRGGSCTRYAIHNCISPPKGRSKSFSATEARLNHYFMRAEEDAIWKAAQGRTEYRTMLANQNQFWNKINDTTAWSHVDLKALRAALGAFSCGRRTVLRPK